MTVTRESGWNQRIQIGIWFVAAFGGLFVPPVSLTAAEEAPVVQRRKSTLADIVGALLGAESESAPAVAVEPDEPDDTPPAKVPGSTHSQVGDIKIRGNRTGHQLQTFCLNKDGLIFAVVGPPRPYGTKLEGKNNSAEVRVFDAKGKDLRQWTVDFAVQSIAAAPNGTIFVAGNGKIAKFDVEGKLLATADSPHIVSLLKNSAKLKEDAEAQLEEEKEQAELQAKELTQQVDSQKKILEEKKKALDALPEEERTAAAKRKIRTLEMTVRNLETQNKGMLDLYKQRAERSVDDIINEMTGRLKIVNALGASDKDVFIASGVVKGYGYAIWRTSHDFEGAEQIVSGLSGCCGQMDIRCCEENVFVAENSRKRVLQYDREGKKLTQWGEGSRNGGVGAEFGGCCNPMNVAIGSAGEILTAESEGYIKRFTKEGSFLGIVGQAKVSGGCKNVAIAQSPDGAKAYFFDLQGSRIVILDKKAEEAKPAEEEKPATPAEKPALRVPAGLRTLPGQEKSETPVEKPAAAKPKRVVGF